MNPPRPPGPGRHAAGPVESTWGPSRVWLGLAAVLLAAVPWLWPADPAPADPMPASAPTPPATAATPAAAPVAVALGPAVRPVAASSPAAVPRPAQPPQRQRDPGGDLTPDLADYLNPGEKPSMAEVIARLHANGIHSGLGAFQPPGTRPPLIGLAVPADFELPPGYVRHHQATDDGQRIEAILMFSPDVQWVDAQGRPLALPADRVVPPELAPPGLPLRRIVVPAPLDPER